MDFLSDEFIFARTGEPLDKKLRKSKRFKQQIKSLSKASTAFVENLTVWEWKMVYSWRQSI